MQGPLGIALGDDDTTAYVAASGTTNPSCGPTTLNITKLTGATRNDIGTCRGIPQYVTMDRTDLLLVCSGLIKDPYVYISNSNHSVTVINQSTPGIGYIDTDFAGTAPVGIAIAANYNWDVWVADGNGYVRVIDPCTLTVPTGNVLNLRTTGTPSTEPKQFAFASFVGGYYTYITGGGDKNRVWIVKNVANVNGTMTRTVETPIYWDPLVPPTGCDPLPNIFYTSGIAVKPDGSEGWAFSAGVSNRLFKFTIPGHSPSCVSYDAPAPFNSAVAVAFTPNGAKAYVANDGTSDTHVSVLNGSTGAVLGRVNVLAATHWITMSHTAVPY